MIRPTQKTKHIVLGSVFTAFGVAGLALPVISGTLLLIIGFILFSFESPYIEKHLSRLTKKNRFTHATHLKFDRILRKIFKK